MDVRRKRKHNIGPWIMSSNKMDKQRLIIIIMFSGKEIVWKAAGRFGGYWTPRVLEFARSRAVWRAVRWISGVVCGAALAGFGLLFRG